MTVKNFIKTMFLHLIAILVAVTHAEPAYDQATLQAIGKELAKEKNSKSDIQILGNLTGIDDIELQQFIQSENKLKIIDNLKRTPNDYHLVDGDYSQDNSNQRIMSMTDMSMHCKNRYYSESKLPNPVKNLVCLLFDITSMKRTMMEFEIDLTKMPLEKMSKDQIMKAYQVLTEVENIINNKVKVDQLQDQIEDASNRFYTIIPHDFGTQKPSLLNNIELVKTKTDMLNNLLDIEFTYDLLNNGALNSNRNVNVIDYYYNRLKTQIDVLDNSSNEFSVIMTYVKNTHSKTHLMYPLQVRHIFKIVRQGEEKRYKPFKHLPNRQLLWHGSGLKNFARILCQGLRIPPPEVPKAFSVFGKGIYFAENVSKSAHYSGSRYNSTGLLLLAEVALGEMYQLTAYRYITKLPKGKQSTKGVGRTENDPNSFFMGTDGVKVPFGLPVPSTFEDARLRYNEYVVYNEAQIHQQYLVEVDFKK